MRNFNGMQKKLNLMDDLPYFYVKSKHQIRKNNDKLNTSTYPQSVSCI